jgi:hypothetical protein
MAQDYYLTLACSERRLVNCIGLILRLMMTGKAECQAGGGCGHRWGASWS